MAIGAHSLILADADVVHRQSCPVCEGARLVSFSKQKFAEATLRHVRCEDCGLVFMNPMPNQEWYDRLYGLEFWEHKPDPERVKKRSAARTRKYLDELAKIGAKEVQNVLEVGAGYGFIGSDIARSFGAKSYVIEPSDSARRYIEENEIAQIVGKTAADLASAPGHFDLVIFSHALENITDPGHTLSLVKQAMSASGRLLIETPNVDWQPSMHIYHPYCYSPTSLSVLLTRRGFSIARIAQSGRPSSVVLPRYVTAISVPADARTSAKPRTQSTGRVLTNHRITRLLKRFNEPKLAKLFYR